MQVNNYFSLKYEDGLLIYADQTKLPLYEEYIATDDFERIAVGIERLELRGAPLIGISAAYGLALGLKKDSSLQNFNKVYSRLASTRPTAVNLFSALSAMKQTYNDALGSGNVFDKLIQKAISLHNEDVEMCKNIGINGLSIFEKSFCNVLTHCNTGKFATAGSGTAFSVIKEGWHAGKVGFVYADETRPLFQGSRLTAYELSKNSIPFSVIPDSAAAVLMAQGKIDLVVTGADRICKNGDSANKIGTYSLAVNCKHHGVPFYIAAPESTLDSTLLSGNLIPIEERNSSELYEIMSHKFTDNNFHFFNPSFDVTPASLIAGIITNKKLYFPPYSF